MRDDTRAVIDRLNAKVKRLQDVEPYLIDLSLRENPVGARVGQTLQDKLHLFPRLREFGFKNILLGTLDCSMPEELEVDDDFMMYLRDNHIDMTGGFAFTDIGLVGADGSFTPSASMVKLQKYGVPNTLHEIYLSPEGMAGAKYTFDQLMRSLPASIAWLNANIRGDGGGRPRILINIVDGCDAFSENLDQTCQALELLAQQPIEGVSMEDDRGTYMPFQVGGYVSIARSYLPPPLKLVVHMHAGGGFENASLIEALLEGADGVWGGLPKRAAIIGHASLGELIANLVRVGNTSMQQYQLANLLPLATGLQILDEQERVPDDLPILGSSAYRLTLEFFRQRPGRFMDLPPDAIGGRYGSRSGPGVSAPPVIAGRRALVPGPPAGSFRQDVLEQMVRLMRRSLREGNRIVWDDPKALLFLYEQAGGTPP